MLFIRSIAGKSLKSQFQLDISGLELNEIQLGKSLNDIQEILENVSVYFLDSFFKEKAYKHEFSAHLEIVDSDKMRKLNREYRNKDKSTDVLSFPVFDDLRNNSELLNSFYAVELGDLFICWGVLEQQAVEFEINNWEELIQLYIHGFLHLTGFDHEISESEQKVMEFWEGDLLAHASSIVTNGNHYKK